MLILTRRVGEAILIDGGVRIVVLGSDNQGVRLGIEAPDSVGILREEIVQRIAEENIRAEATEDAKELLKSLADPSALVKADDETPPTSGEQSDPEKKG